MTVTTATTSVIRWTGRLWALVAGERLRYGAAVAALVIASLFLYLVPLVPQVVIDGVLVPAGEGQVSPLVARGVAWLGGRELVAANLWWPALVVTVLAIAAGAFTYLRGRWSAVASEAVTRRVRDEVYDHLQRLPCRYFDRARTGDLVQRCTSDVETLRVFLSTQAVEIGRAVIMLVMPIPLMLAIDVRMTVVSLVLIPPIVAFSLVYFIKVKRAFEQVDEAEGRMTTTIQENLTGIRVVRAFARQSFECEKMDERSGAFRDLTYRLFRLLAHFWSISDLLCMTQKGLVLALGAYWLAIGELSVGAFYFFITAVSMFIWPVRMMGRILTELGKAMVALGRIQEILDEPLEAAGDEGAGGAAPALRGGIVFDAVEFSHGEESPVLHGISFTVEPGETLALVGPSGCGKSTIVNLLLRLYDVDAGTIQLDGRDLRRLDRYAVRGQIAVVMQEPFLYSKSLRDNLVIGRPTAGEDEMIEAAMVACVHESIVEFDDGYDTVVGERGVTLSGGQRQRVALARALLQSPAILVLDDALSAVDADTETLILDALRHRHGRQTTVVAAHRLSTLMHADRILVLDRGRIVQSGTHATLVAEDGLYRRLWAIQTDDKERCQVPFREKVPDTISPKGA